MSGRDSELHALELSDLPHRLRGRLRRFRDVQELPDRDKEVATELLAAFPTKRQDFLAAR